MLAVALEDRCCPPPGPPERRPDRGRRHLLRLHRVPLRPRRLMRGRAHAGAGALRGVGARVPRARRRHLRLGLERRPGAGPGSGRRRTRPGCARPHWATFGNARDTAARCTCCATTSPTSPTSRTRSGDRPPGARRRADPAAAGGEVSETTMRFSRDFPGTGGRLARRPSSSRRARPTTSARRASSARPASGSTAGTSHVAARAPRRTAQLRLHPRAHPESRASRATSGG